MPKNRTISFGYCMRNGEIIAEPTESEVVVKIFEEYLNGSSFLQIARLMESEKIRYTADSAHWNKNMVKRIIENEKYLGNGMKYKGFFVKITSDKKLSREDKNGKIVDCEGFTIEVFADESEKLVIGIFSAAVDFELLNNSIEEAEQFAKDYVDCEEKEYQRMIDEFSTK